MVIKLKCYTQKMYYYKGNNAIIAPPNTCNGVCLLVYILAIKTGIAKNAQIMAGI